MAYTSGTYVCDYAVGLGIQPCSTQMLTAPKPTHTARLQKRPVVSVQFRKLMENGWN